MVISYEIYEKIFGEFPNFLYEMTTSVKFILSYDYFKQSVIVLKVESISAGNRTLFSTASLLYASVTKYHVVIRFP